MTTQYEALRSAALYPAAFRVPAPQPLGEPQMTPRKPGFFIARSLAEMPAAPEAPAVPPPAPDAESAPPAPVRLLVPAQWGLVPHWVKSAANGQLRATKLVNAKSDLVSTSTAFRDAWLANQRCIVPMMAFIAEDWRSGKARPTRIARVDGQPMGVAGLWARWRDTDGTELLSYALITVNANAHALMNRYQAPGSEKSMPAILNEGAYDAWLDAKAAKAKEFLRAYPAQKLLANPVEKKGSRTPSPPGP